MCQVEVKGQAKMNIGCNTAVAEGMEVLTQETSQKSRDAQSSTLEFILINHPLDCTVCDQAGHCKLQDYHYDYNAKPSRFLEEKEHKVKALPLGPTVMLDGERCIMCTRCIRFCDEVTGTSELGMLNRGDRSVIAVNEGHELNNALSGTVVDLCPVGALTHREWRFNTRIWFTKETDSICPGCSTGCNVKVAVRDRQVVQVKARLNSQVNKEWLCDQGRYGFERFLPGKRLTAPQVRGVDSTFDQAIAIAKTISGGETLVFVAPDLLTEEYIVLKRFLDKCVKQSQVAIAYRERKLSKVEEILISPDYAANFRGAEFSGLVTGDIQAGYEAALERLRSGTITNLILVGDRCLTAEDATPEICAKIKQASLSIAILTDAASSLAASATVVLPERSILEKSGLLINRKQRLQYTDRVVEFPDGTQPAWRLINQLAVACGSRIVSAQSDRDLTLEILASESRLAGLKIATIKQGGVCLDSYKPGDANSRPSSSDARV